MQGLHHEQLRERAVGAVAHDVGHFLDIGHWALCHGVCLQPLKPEARRIIIDADKRFQPLTGL